MIRHKTVRLIKIKTLIVTVLFFQILLSPFIVRASNASSDIQLTDFINSDVAIVEAQMPVQVFAYAPEPLTQAERAEIERVARENSYINDMNSFLYSKNSPLAGYGSTLLKMEKKYGVPSNLVIAISGVESSFCQINFKAYNCWGWMTSDRFGSYEQSLDEYYNYLASYYFARGYDTPETIGYIYCVPPEHWIVKVRYFLNQMNF